MSTNTRIPESPSTGSPSTGSPSTSSVFARIDLRDVLVVIGLAMMFAGLWFVDWRWALVVVGALIAGLAVWSARV